MKDLHPNGALPMIEIDKLIGYDFVGEHAGQSQKATVKEQVQEGVYHVEYADGATEELTYDEIMNTLYKTAEEGNEVWTFNKIINHKLTTENGKQIMKVLVEWDVGEPTWEPLSVIKKDDPISVAEYVKEKDIVHQPHWKWALKYIKNPKRFLRLTKQIFLTKKKNGPKYKFGVRVPRNIKEALALDKENKNTLWAQAIKKEMDKIMEFEVFTIPKDGKPPSGYKRIPCHMIFDVKFDGRRKARFVAGGHLTTDPGEESYSGVVAPEAVRLGMMAAVNNSLEVVAADIGNAYLHAKTKEKLYTVLSDEYGALAGKTLVFHKSLYGLKTSGARFHEHLSDILRALKFRPSKADADLWIKDQGDHYEYVARYVDDILVFSRDPMVVIREMEKTYQLQGVGTPDYYLGADFQVHRKDGIKTISICARTYVTNVVKRIEELLGESLKSYETPMATNDHPEIDETCLLDSDDHSKYRMLIGCAQWAIIIGRIDITYATQTMAKFSAAPREGHLKRVLRIFGYLKAYTKHGIMYAPGKLTVNGSDLPDVNWQEQYPGASEEIPSGMPPPKGTPASITVFVDADHAGDKVTRRSVTGIILYVNKSPIKWYSKRQNTIESSTYGAELVALRIAVEMVMEYRYKLRMMGMPVEGPDTILCDNKSAVLNTTLPSSTLKKKHNAIAYHKTREAVAANIIKIFT